MAIEFKSKDHSYTSTDGANINWTSVTSLVSKFKEPFDREAVALSCSKNPKSKKWFGLEPEEILAIWEGESLRATTLGSWYHDQREQDLIACSTLERRGVDVPIIHPIEEGDKKLAPDQKLVEGIYPEHMVYLKSAKLCGQADRVEVVGDEIDLYDYKTNKEIKTQGFRGRSGGTKKMLGPCDHLDDCHLMHYSLQLSVYMYIMLKHNHHLKPGKMQIHHIVFEKEGEDKYGYPITAREANGDPIVKEIVEYDLEYMQDEVRSMIKWMKLNRAS